MEENQARALAAQLRKPEGDFGAIVGKKMNESNRLMNLKTIEFLDPQPGEKILEIGMGNGLFVSDLFSMEETIQYMGCDYSSLMVEEAKKINQEWINKGVANFICLDADALPVSGVTKIFTVNTLYFWQQPNHLLKTLKKVLVPGGSLVIAIRPKASMLLYPFVDYGFTLYTKETLESLLVLNGYKIDATSLIDEPVSYFQGTTINSQVLLVKAKSC